MTANLVVPAAQYLRMSTEHQQYSLENQSAAIQKYAESRGFKVVRTYSDAAKRGLVLKHRIGLRQLLKDVVGGTPDYRVILVYDVSRWGRFQDTDESAHYEFLCKSAGVPLHYCAETFANDGSLPSLIMKTLKRTMAAEFSRELGVKVLAGQKRLAHLGFKQGGLPGYGLRRMLVSADRVRKQPLAHGERKSIATDRVILVPGPADEVQCVRDIYRMLVSDKLSVCGIACELNRRGVRYMGRSVWDYQAVYGILTHPKYVGCHTFNRTSCQLCTPTVRLPRSDWILTPGAFEPIVDEPTYSEAQRVLQGRTINKSDEELLDSLRALVTKKRRLSLALIQDSKDVPSPSTYRRRFGSLRQAYELIECGRPHQFGPIDLRRRTQALREELISQIAAIFPEHVSIVRRGGRWRTQIRLVNGSNVSVVLARSVRIWKQTLRWRVVPLLYEQGYPTLLARLNEDNTSFLDFHVIPSMDRVKSFDLRLNDGWLNRGQKLSDLLAFHKVVVRVCAACERSDC
ncbi:MAG TPA: recombinase family protein [Terriglobales bacterium]|jgi:DNA invertase Pin-like site-specific DNA recombinase|nr:recombinase family protein [Terriglobales bacterium]